MYWQEMFTPAETLSAQEARTLLDAHPPGAVQIIDVRQPWEYEQGHLPGAILLPLRQLLGNRGMLKDLNPARPTLVYCAVGGRSLAATQWLQGQGFGEVYNLSLGIKGWLDPVARGPHDLHLSIIPPDAPFEDALALSYAMEDGLHHFYDTLSREAPDAAIRDLLTHLAAFEIKHKKDLLKRQTVEHPEELAQQAEARFSHLAEGGVARDALLAEARAFLSSPADLLGHAMALETQALDFYLRLAKRASDPGAKRTFESLAEEERMHLGYLDRELERMHKAGQL